MLDAIKKKLGMSPSNEETQMVDEPTQAELSVVVDTAQLDALQASFTELEATAQATAATLEATLAELTNTKAALEDTVKVNAALVAAAKKTKEDARLAKVTAAVGTLKAASVMEATKDLNDESFNAVVAAMTFNLEAESKSALFVEAGVDVKPIEAAAEEPVDFKQYSK